MNSEGIARSAVLHRLSWRDVMPLDTRLIGPCQNGVAGELAAHRIAERNPSRIAMVADNHLRWTAFCDEPIKLPGNAYPR